jgi:hypothetical protein
MRQSIKVGLAILLLASSVHVAFAAKPDANANAKLIPAAKYECLLGAYTNNKKPTPFITLAIPDGSNILNDDVMSAMRGAVSLGEIAYASKGYFTVPKTGTYEFECSLATVVINGRSMKFGRKTGSMPLEKGEYQIELYDSNHGGPNVNKAKIVIRLAGTADTVPIYNTGRDIQKFMATTIGGTQVIPVVPFDPETAKLDAKPAKK